MTSTSISFDRAAGFYDQTRGLPAHVSDEVASLASELIGADAGALEIGVGTGRITKPLIAQGAHMTGVDLSRAMMARIRQDVPRAALINGDITRLPLASASFDAVIAVHIFHLVGDWRGALAEARRMLRPGGVLLRGHNDRPPSPIEEMRDFLRERLAALGLPQTPIGAVENDIESALIESGATMEERRTRTWSSPITFAQDIDGIQQRVWSSLWRVSDDALAEVVPEMRAFVLKRFGSLDATVDVPQQFVWKRFAWA